MRKIGIAVLTHSHMLDIRNARSNRIQTSSDSQRREAAKMLLPIQTLFRNGKNNFSVLHDGGRCVGVEHVEAQNEHETGEFSSLG